MFKISRNGAYKNMISMTRGDTAYIPFSLVDNYGADFELSPNDCAILTVKRDTYCDEVLFEVYFKDGFFRIDPEWTKDLEYGDYVYDVEVRLWNGDVFTVIPPSILNIEEEVGWH